jgi:hypothetical protein
MNTPAALAAASMLAAGGVAPGGYGERIPTYIFMINLPPSLFFHFALTAHYSYHHFFQYHITTLSSPTPPPPPPPPASSPP